MSKEEIAPYDMSINTNSSALAWTKFFRECCPECNLDDETMLAWFANAMMAMHDHIYQTSPPKQKPLSEDEIDLGYQDSPGNYYDLAFRDGVRFAEKYHKIGINNV